MISIMQDFTSYMGNSFPWYIQAGFVAACMIMWNLSRAVTYLLTTWEILSVASYYLFHVLVTSLQKVKWTYNGIYDHLVMAQYGGVYDTCVHVQRIVQRGRFSIFNHTRPWDFIGLHENFAHPQTLLNPSITLYCVTATHVYFVECPEDVDVHHSRTSPFMYMAQYHHAIKLYSIPHGHFHRLAEEVGNPRIPVIWISSTGRCGSTLICQMLEKLPGTRVMSEPDSITNISLMARAEELSPREITNIIRSNVRLLCRDEPGIQRIAIKTRFNSVYEVENVMESFPEFQHIYMYRNLGNVLKSYYKFLHRDTAICILERLVNSKMVSFLMPFIKRYLVHFIAGDACQEKVSQILPDVGFMGWATAIICSYTVEFQYMSNNKGIMIPTLHYDDLMRNPLEVTTKLFELWSLPAHYVQLSLVAMQVDTQQGTVLSNISNSSLNIRKITGKDIKDINIVLQALDLPSMNQEFYLPNSICV